MKAHETAVAGGRSILVYQMEQEPEEEPQILASTAHAQPEPLASPLLTCWRSSDGQVCERNRR